MFSLAGATKPATSTGFGGFGGTGFGGANTGTGSTGTTGTLSSNIFGGGNSTAAAANTSTGGLGGIPLTRSNSIPAIAFGSTSATANNPASSATGFGIGGAPSTPAFGSSTQPLSFGSTAASTPGTTGAFGASTTSGTGSTFGTATTTGTASAPAFGAAAKPATTFGSFGQPTTTSTLIGAPSAAQQAVRNGENIPFDTPYKDLPAAYKAELDALYRDFKQPMRQELDQIARSRGQGFDTLSQQLRQLHVSVMQLETEQLQLQSEVRPFLEDLKPFHRDFHSSSINGLTQIRSRGGGGLIAGGGMIMLDEQLPDRFFLQVADRLEMRLAESIAAVHYFEQQLAARIRVLEARNNSYNGNVGDGIGIRGAYGQVLKVSPQMLLQLIKQQAIAFSQVAAEVGAVHQMANQLRQAFLSSQQQRNRGSTGRLELNPFEAADRREAAEEKQAEDKIRLEQQQVAVQYHLQMQQQQQGQQGSSSAFPTLTAPTSTFGSSTFGLGSTTSATPGSSTSAPAFGSFGVGGTTGTGAGSATTAALDLAGMSKATTSTGFGAPTMSSTFGSLTSGISPINTSIAPAATFGSLGGGDTSNPRKNKKK